MNPLPVPALSVALHGVDVGTIEPRGEGSVFRLSESYLGLAKRPVLGQTFEDRPHFEHRSTQGVPRWFANLLPEGALRTLTAELAGVHGTRASFLLARLGEDLPGAVVVRAVGEFAPPLPGYADDTVFEQGQELKFSLAGVQLKFSALASQDKLTIPAYGLGGDWIVKLPDQKYPGVPENEYSMMRWAAAAGLEVPETRLVRVGSIAGLPTGFADGDAHAFAIRRFDRSPGGTRTHIEDFAQVLNLDPAEKYGKTNFDTILRIVHSVAGEASAMEMIRRLVFNVLIGNGDAHAKNWSLAYPDRVTAQLSPAYDLVSTVAYIPNDSLGLNLAGTKVFEEITLERFRSLARRADLDPDVAVDAAREQIDRTRTAWRDVRGELPLSPEAVATIDQRLNSLPLARGG